MVMLVVQLAMEMMMMKDICERHELTRWILDESFDCDVGGAVGNGDDDDEGYL